MVQPTDKRTDMYVCMYVCNVFTFTRIYRATAFYKCNIVHNVTGKRRANSGAVIFTNGSGSIVIGTSHLKSSWSSALLG